MINKQKIKNHMLLEAAVMIKTADDGEVDSTLLAEETCQAFELYEENENIPEWLFDMAVTVSGIVEKEFHKKR